MEYDNFKEIVKTLNEAKPKREGFVMIPSVKGFDVYRLPEDLLRVFLYTQSALAENTPTSEKQCATPAVVNCAKCGAEEDGYGMRGELCKACDHLMKLDAM